MNIQIDYTQFKNQLQNYYDDLMDFVAEKNQRVSNFKLDQIKLHKWQLATAGFPNQKHLMLAIDQKNPDLIDRFASELFMWAVRQNDSLPIGERIKMREKIRPIIQEIEDYASSLHDDTSCTPEHVQASMQQVLKQTEANMEELKKKMEEAILRIPFWNNSNIKISAEAGYDETGRESSEPATNAQVYVGKNPFTLFIDQDKFIIDDLIEGGDTDFFHSPQDQADYFNLVKELQNPGSTQTKKMMTLYTARPREHRDFYMNATKLPVNLFLTNNIDHAEGLASDLSSGKKRDVWKVRIDTRYLTQTLDGRVKEYQITTDAAPIASMDLITPGH